MGNRGVLDKVKFFVNKSPIRCVSHPKDQVHVLLIMFCDRLAVAVVVTLVVLVYELTLPGKTFGGRREEHIILFVFIFF